VGLRAELVLLDADPLADIRNSRSVAGIVTRGRGIEAAALGAAVDEQSRRYAADQRFVDRLFDNDIAEAMTWYAEQRQLEPSYRVAPETLACQAMRALRDEAPETAFETLQVLFRDTPRDPLGALLLPEVRHVLEASQPASP
jgi:hypothetical protein